MQEITNLNQLVSEIKFFENQAVVSYREIGKRLAQAKEQVGHGNWETWIDENLGYSSFTAQRLIKVNKEFPNPAALMDLNFTKALALTNIKDPEEREEFIENHEVEDLTVRELQKQIKEFKEREQEKEEINQSLLEELQEERQKEPEIIEKEVFG